jgi:hypothetical protein
MNLLIFYKLLKKHRLVLYITVIYGNDGRFIHTYYVNSYCVCIPTVMITTWLTWRVSNKKQELITLYNQLVLTYSLWRFGLFSLVHEISITCVLHWSGVHYLKYTPFYSFNLSTEILGQIGHLGNDDRRLYWRH